jgi:hypothetical protein
MVSHPPPKPPHNLSNTPGHAKKHSSSSSTTAAAAAAATTAQAPATAQHNRDREARPSREGPAQRAAQDVTGLKDYQLGDCLGKGAFGSVYRALNWGTGETVAIKQVRLENLGTADLKNMEMEIDLLKNLNHPNIVKYHGFVRSSESLYIILE